MFFSCANPKCQAKFHYRQGAVFRFSKQLIKHGQRSNNDSVQHFWLCRDCAQTYRLEYLPDYGVLVKRLI